MYPAGEKSGGKKKTQAELQEETFKLLNVTNYWKSKKIKQYLTRSFTVKKGDAFYFFFWMDHEGEKSNFLCCFPIIATQKLI